MFLRNWSYKMPWGANGREVEEEEEGGGRRITAEAAGRCRAAPRHRRPGAGLLVAGRRQRALAVVNTLILFDIAIISYELSIFLADISWFEWEEKEEKEEEEEENERKIFQKSASDANRKITNRSLHLFGYLGSRNKTKPKAKIAGNCRKLLRESKWRWAKTMAEGIDEPFPIKNNPSCLKIYSPAWRQGRYETVYKTKQNKIIIIIIIIRNEKKIHPRTGMKIERRKWKAPHLIDDGGAAFATCHQRASVSFLHLHLHLHLLLLLDLYYVTVLLYGAYAAPTQHCRGFN